MTTVRSVLLGKGRKHIGDVVVYRRLGKTVFRAMPPEHYKNWKEPSPAQVTQQLRFKQALTFMKLFNRSVNVGFRIAGPAKHMTAFNLGMSFMKKNAITTTPPFNVPYPNLILFPEVSFSSGALMIPGMDSHSSSKTTQQVDLTWIDNSGQGNATATDQIQAEIYNKTTGKQFEFLPAGAMRSDGTVALQLPGGFMSTGDKIEIYSFFVSADNKLISNTMFWGEDTVA